ncbi:MAG: hypothetical protein WD065_06765 [Planctomycetaceae bacterium]
MKHFIGIVAFLSFARFLSAAESIDVGSRRQLFVDGYLIERIDGVRQVLHQPVRRDAAIKPEHPWEQNGVSYMVAFKGGDRFRAWYRADNSSVESASIPMTAYAESDDGIHWTKPNLGIIEFNGSKENNLVWAGEAINLAPFRDDNPNCDPQERYKAIARTADLCALVSPDGLHWKLIDENPISTDRPFDSHNIGFWDDVTKQYVAYTRGIRSDGKIGRGMEDDFMGGVRWIRRTTSKDFRNWTPLEPIDTGDAPSEEFYTNSTMRYERAPDYLLMFPSRFASAREPKPGWKFGKGVDDIAFLSSRDGVHFDRTFMEAFIRPGLDEGNWHERSLYMERAILQTSPNELSLYCMQNWRLPSVNISRYTLRPDGFVSIEGPYEGGELVTKPLIFEGKELRLNFATSAVGAVRVEIQTIDGSPIDGFALTDMPEIYGDKLDHPVSWTGGSDLSALAGKPIRLRFVLHDANLYAFRFQP